MLMAGKVGRPKKGAKRYLTAREATAKSPKYESPYSSLVEVYNLTGIVRDMRLKGKSVRDITDFINKNKMIPNDYVLSYNSIYRWCIKNGLGGTIEADDTSQVINTYEMNCLALKTCHSALDTLMVRLDEINKDPFSVKAQDLNQLMISIDRMTLRIQTLTASVNEMQEKVFKYQTVEKVMEIIMAIVSTKVDKETYATIKQVLSDDPILCEALKTIAPANV